MSQSNNNSAGQAASAHRRRTDLMPTITLTTASPASGLSRSSTPGIRNGPRSPGKAVSMSRLDTLSKPRGNGRNGHNLHATSNASSPPTAPTKRHGVPNKGPSSPHSSGSRTKKKMSQSMSHLGPKRSMSLAKPEHGVRSAKGKYLWNWSWTKRWWTWWRRLL